jgi:hypothetical protein
MTRGRELSREQLSHYKESLTSKGEDRIPKVAEEDEEEKVTEEDEGVSGEASQELSPADVFRQE